MSEVNAGGRQSEDSWLDQGVEILGDGLWMWGLFFTASVWERKKDKNWKEIYIGCLSMKMSESGAEWRISDGDRIGIGIGRCDIVIES